MSRILSVLFEINFERALGWAFMAAALEVIIVFFLGVPFSRHILAAMSGMRNAPEEALLGSVLGFVWECSWVVLVVCFLALISRRFKGIILPLPEPLPGKIPWIQLVGLVGIWALIAIVPQKEQHRFITHAALLEKKAYPEALAYLEKYRQSDFPPSRRLEPNPYEYPVWHDLPPTIALLKPETAPWIRHVYLGHLSATLSHLFPQYDSLTNVAAMFSAIEHLPEGKEWLRTNEPALTQQRPGLRYRPAEPEGSAELIAKTNILETLSRMGMSQTNLAKLKEAR
jgi:hypothetical protein